MARPKLNNRIWCRTCNASTRHEINTKTNRRKCQTCGRVSPITSREVPTSDPNRVRIEEPEPDPDPTNGSDIDGYNALLGYD